MTNTNPENPLKLKGIDHLEFTTNDLGGRTCQDFLSLGLSKTHQKRQGGNKSDLYQQGQIRFVLTQDGPSTRASDYFNAHGEGVCKISFLCEDAEWALAEAVRRGAKEISNVKTFETAEGMVRTASIQGLGDLENEFVERPQTRFRHDFEKLAESLQVGRPLKTRMSRIDHLTNNVPFGEMEHWLEFYKSIFGFVETRYFDIKGKSTGLFSKVVQSKDNQIIIPINQPEKADGKSQIQEFLDVHKGPGVQHIALMTPDIISTLSELKERGLNFLDVPKTYYQDLPKRPFKVTEDVEVLERLKILVDGDPEGYLLQIFSKEMVGPLFYELIQRKNHWGFGNGNFQALFDAIERDQAERGYLK